MIENDRNNEIFITTASFNVNFYLIKIMEKKFGLLHLSSLMSSPLNTLASLTFLFPMQDKIFPFPFFHKTTSLCSDFSLQNQLLTSQELEVRWLG